MKIPEKDLSGDFTFLEVAHYYFKLHGDLNSPVFFFLFSPSVLLVDLSSQSKWLNLFKSHFSHLTEMGCGSGIPFISVKYRRLLQWQSDSLFSQCLSCCVLISVGTSRITRNKTCDDEAKICMNAWHKINQNCFFLAQHENSWPVAKLNCGNLEAHLAKFNNKNELVRFPNEHAQ